MAYLFRYELILDLCIDDFMRMIKIASSFGEFDYVLGVQ